MTETKRLMQEKEYAVHAVAQALMEKGELFGEELDEVFEAADAANPDLATPFQRRLLTLPRLFQEPAQAGPELADRRGRGGPTRGGHVWRRSARSIGPPRLAARGRLTRLRPPCSGSRPPGYPTSNSRSSASSRPMRINSSPGSSRSSRCGFTVTFSPAPQRNRREIEPRPEVELRERAPTSEAGG